MHGLSRRRFLALVAAGLGAAACGTQSGAVVTTAARLTATSAPPSTTATTGTVGPTTTSSAPTTTTTTTVAPSATGLEVICKEAWGAMAPAGEFNTHTIEQITIHHTAVVLEDNKLAPSRLRQHQQFHQNRGWPDLAYHFMIDAAGNVYEGRPIDAVGDTGTDYDPTGHLLICCEGNFDEQDLPSAQYEALVQMVAWGAAEFGVDPATVQGHRDVAATSCPGDRLYSLIADGRLTADVVAAQRLEPSLAIRCGPNAIARVEKIEG